MYAGSHLKKLFVSLEEKSDFNDTISLGCKPTLTSGFHIHNPHNLFLITECVEGQIKLHILRLVYVAVYGLLSAL